MTELQARPVPRRRRPIPAGHSVARADAALADVVERMVTIFGELNVTTIARVVRQCRRDLEILSGGSHAEELERLAYERLLRLASTT